MLKLIPVQINECILAKEKDMDQKKAEFNSQLSHKKQLFEQNIRKTIAEVEEFSELKDEAL